MSRYKQRKKYFQKREVEGESQKEALEAGGYNPENNHGTRIEKTEAYSKLKHKYADILLEKISLDSIADEHTKNIVQDKDRGAKNTAIKMGLDRIEPPEQGEIDVGDVQIIVRKK